jgi:hypothetical protein
MPTQQDLPRRQLPAVGLSKTPQFPDRPQNALMNQHADASVGYREPRRAEQARLDTHHVGSDQQDWPSQSGGDE